MFQDDFLYSRFPKLNIVRAIDFSRLKKLLYIVATENVILIEFPKCPYLFE